ncbi:MAG: c-type cytochrome, partial [Isosphaeraceae bacterium]
DPSPGVRKLAIQFSESRLQNDDKIAKAVLKRVEDADLAVRYQLALSVGEWADPRAGEALAKLARSDAADPWVRAALLSSARPHAAAILQAVVGREGPEGLSQLIEPLVATMAGSGDPATIREALAILGSGEAPSPEGWRMATIARLLESANDPGLLDEPTVQELMKKARVASIDVAASVDDRVAAVRLLARDVRQVEEDAERLGGLLVTTEPPRVQLAAVEALGRMPAGVATKVMVDRWPGLGPAVRASALDALTSRRESTDALLGAIERGALPAASIDATHRQRLLKTGPPAARSRALAAFGSLAIGSRKEVLERYAVAKGKPGDLENGRRVFEKVCSACHKWNDQGHEVGPDLAALTETSFEALLTAILDPNRDVDARYAVYTAALGDGRVLTGLIASETGSGLTLKRQEGQTDVVLRSALEELRTTGQSLMPEGLENDLTPDDVADVIAFVARGRNRPKEVAGNRPEVLVASTDGSVTLPARSAEIYGPTLTYEPDTDNLGYWRSNRDRAAWTFRTEKAATYTVSMLWACAEESAGNRFVVKVGKAPLRAAVGATGAGTWANYQTIFIGETTLPAGTHRLEFLAEGPPRGALLDLRAVVLTPRSAGVYRATTP